MLAIVATWTLALTLSLAPNAAGASIFAKIGAFVKLASLSSEAIGTLALWSTSKRLPANAAILTGQIQTVFALVTHINVRAAAFHALRFRDKTGATVVTTALTIRHRCLTTWSGPVRRACALQRWWLLQSGQHWCHRAQSIVHTVAGAAIMLTQLTLILRLANAFGHMIHQLTLAQIAQEWTVVGYFGMCFTNSLLSHHILIGTLAGVAGGGLCR